MKFGHDLPRNQVPEWASSYINYKGLKKLIKNAAEALKHGSEPDLAGKCISPLNLSSLQLALSYILEHVYCVASWSKIMHLVGKCGTTDTCI